MAHLVYRGLASCCCIRKVFTCRCTAAVEPALHAGCSACYTIQSEAVLHWCMQAANVTLVGIQSMSDSNSAPVSARGGAAGRLPSLSKNQMNMKVTCWEVSRRGCGLQCQSGIVSSAGCAGGCFVCTASPSTAAQPLVDWHCLAWSRIHPSVTLWLPLPAAAEAFAAAPAPAAAPVMTSTPVSIGDTTVNARVAMTFITCSPAP